jgi:hypothetical protein
MDREASAQQSTLTEIHRGFTSALRRSTLDFCLGKQRQLGGKGNLRSQKAIFSFVSEVERGAARAKDTQGAPIQSHVSPSVLVYEDESVPGGAAGGGAHIQAPPARERTDRYTVNRSRVYFVLLF